MGIRKGTLESVGMNSHFWAGKRVFITGHTGFKGSWLCIWLKKLGAEITGYSLAPPTLNNLFEQADVPNGMRSIIGDIRDLHLLKKSIKESNPEIVIHLAAQSLVRESYSNPVDTYATNVIGTVNILEAVRSCKSVKSVVIVTTDKCYQNNEWLWPYRENDPLGGYDPYSSSKACAELVTETYRNCFFKKNQVETQTLIASARAGNVIGGGDWSNNRLIPDMMRAYLKKEPILLRNPNAIRPWQHVLEPLRGYLNLAEQLYIQNQQCATAFNFGPRQEDVKNVSWIANYTKNFLDLNIELDTSINPHEAETLKLDISKANSILLWSPVIHLSDAMEMTINWYISYSKGENMKCFTENQIDQYEKMLG